MTARAGHHGHPAGARYKAGDRGLATSLVNRITAADFPWRPEENPGALVLFDSARTPDLNFLLRPPAVAALDVGCKDPLGGLKTLPAHLLLRVTTATAMRHDVAGPLTDALAARLPRLRGITTSVRTALQEAIGNAVMHGNLALGSELRESIAGLAMMGRLMEQRAADPRYGRRPVTVAARWDGTTLVLTVEDRGTGFRPPTSTKALPGPIATSGRGLAEIRAHCSRVTFSTGGRRITMRFRLP